MFYSSRGTRWTLVLCSSSIRSKVIRVFVTFRHLAWPQRSRVDLGPSLAPWSGLASYTSWWGWPRVPPPRIFKAIVVAEKFKRRWKELVERYMIQSCWHYFLTCDVTGRSNNVKLYWFTAANCFSNNINLPNKMELDKNKYHRSDLGVASWTYFEDLWRHKKGQYWPIRGQLGESNEPAHYGTYSILARINGCWTTGCILLGA